MEHRYFIRVSGNEVGWIYLHNVGDAEDDEHIHLWNELVPGEEIPRALKSDYLEITKNQYEQILDKGFPPRH